MYIYNIYTHSLNAEEADPGSEQVGGREGGKERKLSGNILKREGGAGEGVENR